MGFFGSIVSDVTKAVTDPGALISDAAKAVLPKNMGAIGDILGGIADIESGHPLQALSHLTDTLKDLPQLAQGLSGAQANDAAAPAGTAGAEPSPPPTRASQSSAAESTTSTAAPAPESPKVNVQTVGKGTVISIDDGTHTTVITEKPGHKPFVSVHLDRSPTPGTSGPGAEAPVPSPPSTPSETSTPGVTTPGTTAPEASTPGTTAPGATPASTPGTPPGTSTPAANKAPSAAPTPQAPNITVQRFGRETITTVDNGRRTTVIVQRPGQRPIVRTHADKVPSLRDLISGSATVAAGSAKPASSTAAAISTTGTSSSANGASAGATSTPSGTSAPAATAATAATEPSASTAAAAATDASASTAAAPKDLAGLMAMSPDQFMQAVTSGKIPDSVANSPSAMMQVQARMNQITQMNQLVTGMMAAMHQMEMSIIQNIRC